MLSGLPGVGVILCLIKFWNHGWRKTCEWDSSYLIVISAMSAFVLQSSRHMVSILLLLGCDHVMNSLFADSAFFRLLRLHTSLSDKVNLIYDLLRWVLTLSHIGFGNKVFMTERSHWLLISILRHCTTLILVREPFISIIFSGRFIFMTLSY